MGRIGMVFRYWICILFLYISGLSGLSGQEVIISSGTIFSGSGGIIVIKGNLINDGTFTNQNNTVVLNGAAQTISGDSVLVFNNLTLGGAGFKTLSGGTAVTVDSSLVTGDMLVIGSTGLQTNGSLIVKGTTTGTFTYNRQLLTEIDYGDYHFISAPAGNNSALNNGKITEVYSWDEVSGTWPVESITGLVSGKGYNIDQTSSSDGLISFTGNMVTAAIINATSPYGDVITGGESDYDSRIFVDASGHSGAARSLSDYGGGGWNLLGNTFPSAMLVSKFIETNYNATPELSNFDPNYVAVYLYDGTVDPHGMYYYISNSSGWWGNELSQTHIQAGQGFFVLAMNDFSSFTFDRSMQDHATNDVMFKSTKSEDRCPGILLKAKANDSESHTLVLFNNGMTTGLDPGYDIGQLSTHPSPDIYTLLAQDNGVRFMQQNLPGEGCDTIVIPVGIDFESGGEVFFYAETEPLTNYLYILEDRTAGVFTDMSKNTYSVVLPAGTHGTGRFFIHTESIGTTDILPLPESNDVPDFKIWANDNTVYLEGEVSSKAIVAVYDIQGHLLYENRLTEGIYNTFSFNNHPDGIFVVRIIDGSKVTSKRIFL